MISAIKVILVLLGLAGVACISAVALYAFIMWIYKMLTSAQVGDIMVYIEYERIRRKLWQAQERYNKIVDEQELLFMRTQPKSLDAEKEKVGGTAQGGTFDNYLISKEAKRIEQRLEEALQIMQEREQALKSKEAELRHSAYIYDKIYIQRHLERHKIRKIARTVHYSEAQVYRILRKIRQAIEDDRK